MLSFLALSHDMLQKLVFLLVWLFKKVGKIALARKTLL